jgi:hypothetical protein
MGLSLKRPRSGPTESSALEVRVPNKLNDLRQEFMSRQADIVEKAQIPLDDATLGFIEDNFKDWVGTSVSDSLGWGPEELAEANHYYGFDDDPMTHTSSTAVSMNRAKAFRDFFVNDMGTLRDFDAANSEHWEALARFAGVGGRMSTNSGILASIFSDIPGLRDDEAVARFKSDPKGFLADQFFGEEYGLAGVRHPGAKYLEAIPGIHPAVANFMAEDFTDPANAVFGLPIAAGSALGLYRAVRHFKNAKVPMRAMADVMSFGQNLRKTINKFTGFGNDPAPQLQQKTAQEIGASIEKLAPGFDLSKTPAAEAFRAAKLAVTKRAGSNELKRIVKFDKQLKEALSGLSKREAEAILEMRLQNVTTHEELLSLQQMFAKKYDLPKSYFNKSQLQEWYFNPRSGDLHKVDAGLEADAAAHPAKYFEYEKAEDGSLSIARFKDNKAGRLLMRQLGADDLSDVAIVKDFAVLSYLGRHPVMRQSALAMAKQRELGGGEHLSAFGNFIARAGVRNMNKVLQNTGAHDPIIKANQTFNIVHQSRMVELTKALGGEVWSYGNGQFGLMAGKGLGAGTKAPKMLTKSKEIGERTRGVLGERWMGDMDLVDVNDLLFYRMNDTHGRNALNAKRAEEGLDPVQTKLFDPEIQQKVDEMVTNLVMLMDSMGDDAIRAGFMTPQQLLNNYLPRMRRRMAKGETLAEALDSMEEIARRQGDEAALPGLAMIRSGELDITEFSVPKLIEAYSRSLYSKIHMGPLYQDLITMIRDPRVTIPLEDKKFLLKYLAHSSGKTTEEQLIGMNSFLQYYDDAKSGLAPYGPELFGEAWEDPGKLESMLRGGTRALAGLFYVGYMGLKTGTAFRNTTQMFYSLRNLGTGLALKEKQPWLVSCAKRWHLDEAARARFNSAAQEQGWITNYFEFVEGTFGSGLTGFGEKTRDQMMFMFRWADLNNRAMTYMAAEEYVEALWKNKGNGGVAWTKALNNLRPSEKALFREAVEADNLDEARKVYARYVVNESQYLYHPENRMLGFRTKSELANQMLNTAFIFKSWNANWAEEHIQAAKAGAAGHSTKFGKAMGASKGVGDIFLNVMMMGYTLELAGSPFGVHMGDHFFPQMPDWWKEAWGVDESSSALKKLAVSHFPLPIQPGVSIFKDVVGEPEWPVMWDLLVKTGAAAGGLFNDRIRASMLDEDFNASSAALDAVGSSMPRLLMAEPFLQDMLFDPDSPRQRLIPEALSLRLENDPDYQTTMEKVAAALTQNPDPWSERGELSMWERFWKAQGWRIRSEGFE